MINLYGPYHDMVNFWDIFFNSRILDNDNIILGGGLNITLGDAKIWGPTTRKDVIAEYFLRRFEENHLYDIIHVKIETQLEKYEIKE